MLYRYYSGTLSVESPTNALMSINVSFSLALFKKKKVEKGKGKKWKNPENESFYTYCLKGIQSPKVLRAC